MKNTALIRRRILARRARVGVVGQGYVGLTLACIAAEAGFPVVGIDTDPARAAALTEANLVVPGVLPGIFRAGITSEQLTFATDARVLADCDIIAICVPASPRNGTPDLPSLESACRDVATHLAPSKLVIVESTTHPGTTDNLVTSILQSTGLRAGRDFLLAYSPERGDPGNQEFPPRSIPKIVGGSTPEATGVATLFYSQLFDKVVTVSSCRAAELAKLLENGFRHVNIALVNEMAMLCNEMEIDVWEVIDAAATKPFGFMAFHPGPGIGGPSIPLDPANHVDEALRDSSRRLRLLEQAQDINDQMPAYVAARIAEALNSHGKMTATVNVLALGVAYKPDIADIQESPALKTIGQLHERGIRVAFHDPYISEVLVGGRILHRTELTRRVVESADCVALFTPHRVYDLEWIAQHAQSLFDARNAYRDDRNPQVERL